MLINSNQLHQFLIKRHDSGKDRQESYHAVDNCIKILSAEIVRLSRLSYSSWKNMEKIRTLDQQIEYLEYLMAAYEKDLKGKE